MINFILQILAALCIVFLLTRKQSAQLWILLILLIGVNIHTSAIKLGLMQASFAATNWIILFEFVMYHIFFLFLLRKRKHRRGIGISLIAYLLFWILNSVYLQGLSTNYQSYSYSLGALGVILGIFFYFSELLFTFDNWRPLHSYYFVWVCGGLFIWIASEIPIMSILNHVVKNSHSVKDWPIIKLKWFSSGLYYSSYILALLWTRKE